MPGGFQSVPSVLSHRDRALQRLYQALGGEACVLDAVMVSWCMGKAS